VAAPAEKERARQVPALNSGGMSCRDELATCLATLSNACGPALSHFTRARRTQDWLPSCPYRERRPEDAASRASQANLQQATYFSGVDHAQQCLIPGG